MNFTHLPTWTLINAGEATVGSEWRYSDILSPYLRLYYIEDGEGEIVLDGDLLKLRAGYMYFIPALTRHSTRCHGHMKHYYLHIAELTYEWNDCLTNAWNMPFELEGTPDMLRCFAELVKSNPEKTLTNNNPLLYDSAGNISDLIDHDIRMEMTRKLRNNALISLLIAHWMHFGYYEERTSHQGIKGAILYIFKNHSRPITLEQLAEKAGLSTSYFARMFRRHTGQSVGSFIMGVRLHRARRTLETSVLPVTEVAAMAGYDDVNYFIRIFRRKFGMTPAVYRRTMRDATAVHPQSVGNISDKITSDELDARLSSGSKPR